MSMLQALKIYNTMLKVQFKYNTLCEPEWLSDSDPFFNKAVVFAGRLLDETQRYWSWKPTSGVLSIIEIDNQNLLNLWSVLLTTTLIKFQGDFDKASVYLDSTARQQFSLHGSLELLIKNSIDKNLDIASLLHVTEICGISLANLYQSFCAQQALNRFRVEQGYMGIGAGNYVDSYPALNWNDQTYAFTFSRQLSINDPDLNERVYVALGDKYRQVLPEIKRHAIKSVN